MNLKRIAILAVVLIVVFSVFRIAVKISASKNTQPERAIPVLVKQPVVGTIENIVTLTGDIKADKEVSVRPRTMGRVEEIYVKEGDYVTKGQKLLSFTSGMSVNDPIYEDMIVRAPISGTVGMQLVKIGDQVLSQMGSVNPVFTLYDTHTVKIYSDVPEKFFSLVKRGTAARIYFDAYPSEKFSGKVNNVRPVVDPLSRTTQVEIILPNNNSRIKPGMFAKVDLILSGKSGVIIIPFDAVMGETDKYVFVSQNGTVQKKTVVLGIQEESNVEVVSGLTPQDKVIVLGQRVVKEGSKIEETKE